MIWGIRFAGFLYCYLRLLEVAVYCLLICFALGYDEFVALLFVGCLLIHGFNVVSWLFGLCLQVGVLTWTWFCSLLLMMLLCLLGWGFLVCWFCLLLGFAGCSVVFLWFGFIVSTYLSLVCCSLCFVGLVVALLFYLRQFFDVSYGDLIGGYTLCLFVFVYCCLWFMFG